MRLFSKGEGGLVLSWIGMGLLFTFLLLPHPMNWWDFWVFNFKFWIGLLVYLVIVRSWEIWRERHPKPEKLIRFNVRPQRRSPPDGPYESYHKNGQLRVTTTRKDGELDGPYEWYYEDGQLRSRGTYKDNEKCGEWIEDGETVTYDPC